MCAFFFDLLQVSQQQRLLESYNRNRGGALLQESKSSFRTGRDLLAEDETVPYSSQLLAPFEKPPPQDAYPVYNHSSVFTNLFNTSSDLVVATAKRPRFDLTTPSINGDGDDGNSSEDSLDEILNFNPFASGSN